MLHDAAFVFLSVRVFEPQPLLGSVFFEISQLFAVDGSSALLSNELDGIFILHSTLYQSQGNQHWSPSQTCHTVHSHAAAGVLLKLLLQQTKPVVHQFTGRRSAVVKGPVHHSDAVFLQRRFIIRALTHSNHCGGPETLQVLYKGAERAVGGVVSDQESHVFVTQFDRSGSVHGGSLTFEQTLHSVFNPAGVVLPFARRILTLIKMFSVSSLFCLQLRLPHQMSTLL